MLKKIARSVLIIHLILIALLLGGSPLSSPKRKPLIVKTVTITPKPQIQKPKPPPSTQPARSTPPKPPSPSNTAKKKPATTPQKATSTKPAAPKPAPASKPVPPPQKKAPLPPPPPVTKSAPSPSSSKLAQLNQALQESLQEMESPPPSNPIAKTPSMALPKLKIDRLEENSATDYAQKITDCLHESLHLPDFGEVKIQLTLHQDGRIVKLVVLEAENERNKRYLEETLPYLRLPPFTGAQKERTLTFTFCNEF